MRNPPNGGKGAYVREMFATIAPRYDLTNRVLTGGLDESWRRRAIRLLAPAPNARILDLCCGTGDLAFFLLRADRTLDVTGFDFCRPILARAH
jgi:demethylmenaquinone methyltransferase/2-methoxy-6-polyprenyl-1,4-benzoquinol methylase